MWIIIQIPMLKKLRLSNFLFYLSRFAMDKEIYMFERHTYQEMTYSLPVRSGTHTIILKFAEVLTY